MATKRTIEEVFDTSLTEDSDAIEALLELADDIDAPQLMSVEELESQEPPVWYLEQFIQEDSLTILYSPPKVGKTFLALEWSHDLALGKPWLDFMTVPIRVLYCSAEGNRTLGERTKALREARMMDPPENLKFLPGSRRLFSKGARSAASLELVHALNDFRPHLVVLDTLARHSPGGDVAANLDMGRVISMIDDLREAFGCSFLLVHHTRKDKKDYLGAQALFGSADAMVELDPTDEGFEIHTISKDLESYTPPWNFCIKAVSDLPGWAVVDHGERMTSGTKQDAVLDLLKDLGTVTAAQVQMGIWGKEGKSATNILNRLKAKGLVKRSKKGGPGQAAEWEAS